MWADVRTAIKLFQNAVDQHHTLGVFVSGRAGINFEASRIRYDDKMLIVASDNSYNLQLRKVYIGLSYQALM